MSLSGPILHTLCLIVRPFGGFASCSELFQVSASSMDAPFQACMQAVVIALQHINSQEMTVQVIWLCDTLHQHDAKLACGVIAKIPKRKHVLIIPHLASSIPSCIMISISFSYAERERPLYEAFATALFSAYTFC